MVKGGIKLYVEGGGDSKFLKVECRRGFREFLLKIGIEGDKIQPVACGSRQNAFDSFCTAVKNNKEAFLLIDSEEAVNEKHQRQQAKNWKPWKHLFRTDKWKKPYGAEDIHCHLMTQIMESWFLCDQKTLVNFFGQGFQKSALPNSTPTVEKLSKSTVLKALKKATANCKKKCYNKGEHSFKILALLNSEDICKRSLWAKRLVDTLREHT